MKFYFLSSRPCILKIGGAYFGSVGSFEKFADLCVEDKLFVEFIPQDALPVCFFIDDNLRFCPPQGCEVYFLKDGVALYVKDFPHADTSFSLIAQKRFSSTLVSVFRQGDLYAALSTPESESVQKLPPEFLECSIFSHERFYCIEGKNALAIFSGKGELFFLENIHSYTLFEGGMEAITPLFDGLGSLVKQRFSFTEDKLVRTEYTLFFQKSLPEEFSDALLPYAFFQSVLFRLSPEQFLSPALQEKAESLQEFLGDFCAVAFTKNQKEIALVYKKRERVFELSYYTVEIENGKITDIKG